MLLLGAAIANAQAPADYGPVSADVSEIQYPHPVSYLPFVFYGNNVRMAYMDVKPTRAPNGRKSSTKPGASTAITSTIPACTAPTGPP